MVVMALYLFVPIFTFVFLGGGGGKEEKKEKEKKKKIHFKPNCVANKTTPKLC